MLRLYADECVKGAIVRALRERHIDLLTVVEDGRESEPDTAILDRATELGRVLFSQDDDLLAEATRRQRAGEPFTGMIFAHQQHVSLGVCIEDLELLATLVDPDEMENWVEFLPL